MVRWPRRTGRQRFAEVAIRAAAETPSAASPIVPVTTTAIAGLGRRAPHDFPVRHSAEGGDRNRERSRRAIGIAAEQRAADSAPRPRPGRRERREPCLLDAAGSAIESRNPAGLAPLAARSERFIRSALRPIVSGRIVGKKMHAGDDAVGREHEIAARRRREHRSIVGKAQARPDASPAAESTARSDAPRRNVSAAITLGHGALSSAAAGIRRRAIDGRADRARH